jgi:monoamine oxidase
LSGLAEESAVSDRGPGYDSNEKFGTWKLFSEPRPEDDSRLPRRKRVVIVGSGLSGTAAMIELSKQPGIEVVCLEGRDYHGGRLCTDRSRFDNVPIETGGAWIHGLELDSKMNPVYKHALAHDMAMEKMCEMAAIRSDGFIDTYPGEDLDLFAEIWWFARIIKNLSQVKELAFKPTSTSALDVILENAHHLKKIKDTLREAVIMGIIELQSYYACKWENTSAGSLGLDKEFEGDHLLLKEGYSELLRRMVAKDNLKEKIVLNMNVTEIEYGEDGVAIKAVDTQTGVQSQLWADYVIVTVPLGVLKNNYIKFTPPLPEAKQQAISNLGFGFYEKVIVKFDGDVSDFWPFPDLEYVSVLPKHAKYVELIKDALERGECETMKWIREQGEHGEEVVDVRTEGSGRTVPETDAQDDTDVGIEIVSMKKLYGADILVLLFYGEAAEIVAALSVTEQGIPHEPFDERIQAKVAQWGTLQAYVEPMLRKAFVNKSAELEGRSMSSIQQVYGTHWAFDRFSRGSFANVPLGASGQDMNEIAKPNGPVYWAGEHTSTDHYSTAHGAEESGRLAAMKLLEVINTSPHTNEALR